MCGIRSTASTSGGEVHPCALPTQGGVSKGETAAQFACIHVNYNRGPVFCRIGGYMPGMKCSSQPHGEPLYIPRRELCACEQSLPCSVMQALPPALCRQGWSCDAGCTVRRLHLMCSCAQTTRKMATLTGLGSLYIKVRQCKQRCCSTISRGALCCPIYHFS